jgi:hypothetical protein
MSINLHFTGEDWQRIERDWSAWWAGELQRPLVLIQEKIQPSGKRLPAVEKFTSNFPLSMPADDVIDRVQAHLQATRFYGDAFPKWWPNFGPGIMAGFVGARVNSVEETVWFEPVAAVAAGDVHPEYQADNIWWKRVRDLTVTAVKRWGGAVAVAHTDLGGNMDVVASLRTTEQLLYEVHDCPAEIEWLVTEVTRLWIRYYRELEDIIRPAGRGTTPWAAIWSPGRCYMLQCDFSYMISPAMFERFVLPDLAACCDYLDHGFYHLDGKGEIPHLDMLLSLPRLRGIQWIPGAGAPPPYRWLPLLQRVRAAGKLCQLYVSPFGARRIVRELGGKGFALSINEQMTESEATDFLRLLASEDKNN